MSWQDEITDGFPAPRDDEPAALRQDILDELSDHLQCAYRRERQRTDDENEARRNVMTRFGDARRIARRIWLDAMKEKIMSQRITLVLVALIAAACIAASAFAWVAVREGREVNDAILAKLEEWRQASAPAASMDWSSVELRLVQGRQGGPPAEGYTASLQGNLYGNPEGLASPVLEEAAGTNGEIDFGPVRPGSHTLLVRTPWGENSMRQIVVRPGRPFFDEVVCPADPPSDAHIEFKLEWPGELEDQRLWVLCQFIPMGREITGQEWRSERGQHRWVLLMADDQVVKPVGVVETKQVESQPSGPVLYETRLRVPEPMTPEPAVEWREGNYLLGNVMAIRPSRNPEELTSNHLLVVGQRHYASPNLIPVDSELPRFQAQPDQQNRWNIPLGPRLVDEIRTKLPMVEKIAGRRSGDG